MMKRFKKLLSALCIIALLVSSIATVFANGDPEAEMPAVQEPAAEANATDNTEAVAAPAAVEEAPAQETAPVTVEETPVQETAPATVEEAPVQETAPATVEEAPAQETTPATVEEAPVQETAPATVEEAPVQETAPATVEEAPAQETASETMEEAPSQGTVPETVEETPAQNDEPAADTTPAQEETADLNAAPVQEDTAPANEADENSEESVVTEKNTSVEEIDELADDPANYSEDELAELEDDGGYIDPEYIAEHMPEITPEMKYENITEMKIGSTISGSAGTDEILYYIEAAKTQSIVLVLQANGNIQVRINERAVNFTENEDGTKSYEIKVLYNETYIIGISGQGTFTLSAETKIVEEPEEEVEEEIDTVDGQSEIPVVEGETAEINEVNDNAENNSNLNGESAEATDEATAAETEVPAEPAEEGITEVGQTEVGITENAQETSAETVENSVEKAADSAESTEPAEEKPAEESEPIIKTWVTSSNNEEGTVTVYANADIELDNQIVWQTRSADSNEWKKAGYGLKLTVEVTDENADNFFRFKLADGEFSPEYQIHATVKSAEEETEEVIEEIPVETEAEEERIVSEETEEEIASVENTEEVTEETVVEEVVEIEAVASEEEVETVEETEEAVAETETTEEEAETEMTEEATETEEKTAEQAESEEETEEAEEEATEEETEEEADPLTEEQLIELGYRKIQIMNQNGTNLYDSTTEEGTVIGTAEAGTELWIKDAEDEGWAKIHTEEDTNIYLKVAEIEKQPPTDEEMLAMGYVKVFVGIDIGANVYSSMDAEETVAHLDAGTEMWVKLIADADRAEIYAEEEDGPTLYISLVDIIARLKPDGMESLPTRELIGNTTLYDYDILYYGTDIIMTVELVNFKEDDVYTVGWQYSTDGEEYFDIEDAHELTYEYMLDEENITYYWRASVVLMTAQK